MKMPTLNREYSVKEQLFEELCAMREVIPHDTILPLNPLVYDELCKELGQDEIDIFCGYRVSRGVPVPK